MKKSIFNLFRKIEGNKEIIFNSYSLALAEVDKDFFKIYNNLDDINLNKLSHEEKELFNEMYRCNFIINNETDEIKNLEYYRLQNITDTEMFYLMIFPTLHCNFDCYYCYEKNKEGFISKEVGEKILGLVRYHAEKKEKIKVAWHGGEPLLVVDIICDLSKKIIDICNRNNVEYFSIMVSNGYLFTDDIINKLKECKISFIQVTLDGPPEIHNKRRYLKNTRKETFNKILENAKKLKKNNITVSILVNINKDINIDALLKLVKILEENDLKDNFCISQEFDSTSSQRTCLNENCYTDEDFAKLSLSFYKKLHDLGIRSLNEKSFYPGVLFNYCEAERFNTLDVDPDGYLYKCPMEVGLREKAIGNILDDKSFNEKYFNNNVKYMTWNPFKFDKCINCNLIPICSGNCPKNGIDHNNPNCIYWKYNIEELIETMVLYKLKEQKTTL